MRQFLLHQAELAGLEPERIRSLICEVFLVPPESQHWCVPDLIRKENIRHVANAHWSEVYDLLEILHREISSHGEQAGETFSRAMNAYFLRKGIGWFLNGNSLEARMEEPAAEALSDAVRTLEGSAMANAVTEFREAKHDLARRPEPDLSGAVQHAMAGLEATARKLTGHGSSLGTLLQRKPPIFPAPLSKALEAIWGYASDKARHGREGNTLELREVEFIVGLAATAAAYLMRNPTEDDTS